MLAANAAQAGYTLPRWRRLVEAPLRASGVPAAAAAAALAAFGAAYNGHAWVQARVFALDGAVAVGLANAVRCALLVLTANATLLPRTAAPGSPCAAPVPARRHLQTVPVTRRASSGYLSLSELKPVVTADLLEATLWR